jgi:sedoheptulokinase
MYKSILSVFLDGSVTYAEQLSLLSGRNVSSGLGSVTHYYNFCNGIIPRGAYKFCTIGDYLVLRLTLEKEPLTHSTNAQSVGLYDIISLVL